MTQSNISKSDTLNSPPEFYEIADGLLVVPRGSAFLNSVDVRYKFLDRIILPGPLASLNSVQILAINRFREWERNADPQFAKALRARRIIAQACSAITAEAILEIGMGKFPIVDDVKVDRYYGVDIDQEAIDECVARGIQAGDVSAVHGKFDTLVAIYSLHFAAEDKLFKAIKDSASASSVMLSVVVDDGSQHFGNVLAALTAVMPLTRVVASSASRRERFVISGTLEAGRRFSNAVASVLASNRAD